MLNAGRIPKSSRRFAGWWSATLLGALLVLPAELAFAEPPREERAARTKSSGSKASGSKASGSSAKARASSSRSSSRSQPRASSSSSRSSRSQPRARSQPRSSSRSQPRASARSQSMRRSNSTSKSESIQRQREDRSARSRPTVRSAPPTVESVRPIERTEGRIDSSQPRGQLTRPRYRTPAERAANERSPAEYSNAGDLNDGIERRRDRDGGDRDRHYEIETGDPDGPTTAVAERGGERRTHDRGDNRGHRGRRGGHYGGHHHHRHHYGCGHYGYGYTPYESGYRYGYSSPYGWARSWGPEIHIYGGGGGSSQYRDVGQGGLDLDLRPATTEIYVDGTYVGVADQFDGFPTYLWLEEGTYEIAFYKEGYETIIRQYTIYPGVTIDVGDRMRPGEAISPVRPSGAYPSSSSEPQPTSGEAPRLGEDSGRIAIAATPGDAAVYLDGHFVGTASEIAELSAGLIVESGDHVVDVVRPGYENQRVPVSLAVGEQIDLTLDLSRP